MRGRLTFALSVSILLIGVASWSRFLGAEKAPANLVAVQQAAANINNPDEVLRDFIEPRATTTASVAEGSLSNTDIIGRQLILDYIDLATSGGAGTESINALANKYVDSIPTLSNAPNISYADIKTVSNTKINFQNYANELTKIYGAYAAQIIKARPAGSSLDTLNPALYSFATSFSTAYTEAAIRLKNLPVPGSIAIVHLKLINSYLSSATAMKALSKAEEDSAAAFAGLIAFNQNLDKEEVLLTEISEILTSHGI